MTRELMGETVLDASERRMLVQLASEESRAAAIEAPAEFGQLRHDIELVSLEVLIEQFEKGMIGSHAKDEGYWQEFFEANTFACSNSSPSRWRCTELNSRSRVSTPSAKVPGSRTCMTV